MPLNFENIDISDLDRDEDNAGLKLVMSEAIKVNPDQQAHINKLSKESGIPEFAVKDNPVEVESKLNFDNLDISGLDKRSPNTAEYLVDFNNAAIAHDDVDALEKLEGTITSIKNYGSDISKSFEKGRLTIESSEIGLKRMYNSVGGTELISDDQIERLKNIDKELKTPTSEKYGFIVGSPVAAAEQLPIMGNIIMGGAYSAAVGGTAGMILGSVIPALGTVAGGLSGVKIGSRVGIAKAAFDLEAGLAFNEFSDLKDNTGASLDPKIAGYAAMTVGGVNAALESFSLMALGKTVTPAMNLVVKSKIAQYLGTETGREMITRLGTSYFTAVATETVTEGLQEFSNIVGAEVAKMVDKDSFKEEDLGKAIDNIINQAPRMVEAAKAGAQASLMFAGTGTVATVISEQNNKSNVSKYEQKGIDALNNDATLSKLKLRDKESFRQFVEKSDGDNNTHIFIDASQVALYLQTKTKEEIDKDSALTLLNNQIQEASSLDGEVQIPVGTFAAELTGTEHFTQLRDSMTMSDNTVSPFRQAQAQQETSSYVRNLMTVAQENANEYQEAQNIYLTVKQQLIDSGRVNSTNASIMAQVVPAWVTAQAKRTGRTVQDVYDNSGLLIEGPLTGEKSRLDAEREKFTQGMNYDETGEINRDENFKNWFGNSQVVDEAGEPLTVYHGTSADFDEFDSEHRGTWMTSNPELSNEYNEGRNGRTMMLNVSMQNPLVAKYYGNWWNQLEFEDAMMTTDDIADIAKERGYDGVILRNISDGSKRMVVGDVYAVFNPTQIKSVNNRGTFDPADPNILRQSPVEPKNLIVTHNITEDGLKYAMELGGLAAPSLAVVNTDVQELTGFGEITLIPNSDILDDQSVRTFDADIYSARQPRSIDILDRKKKNTLLKEIETAIAGTRLYFEGFNNARDLDRDAVFYTYLKSIGKAPILSKVKLTGVAKTFKDVPLDGLTQNKDFLKAVGKDLKKQLDKFASLDGVTEEDVDDLAINWFELEPPKGYKLEKVFNDDGSSGWAYTFNGDTVTALSGSAVLARGRLNQYLAKEGIDQEFNYDKPTSTEINKAYINIRNSKLGFDEGKLKEDLTKKNQNKKLRSDFKDWYNTKYEDLITDKKLDKGKSSVPYTLDNVVREMTRTLQGGETANYGPASIRAKYANRLDYKKDVVKNRHKFVTSEEMEAIKKESTDKFFEAADKLKRFYKYDTESWGYGSDIAEALTTGDMSVFKNPAQAKVIIKELGEYLAGLPTEYFEAKVQRAMDFSEFETALVPKGTKKETIDSLKKYGIKVKYYTGETGRKELLQKESKLLFQPTSDDAPGARGYYDPDKSLIRLTEASDLSTFLHEFAHFMYDMEIKNNGDMLQSINKWFKRNAADVAKEANKYFDVERVPGPINKITIDDIHLFIDNKTTGNENKDSAIIRATHEQFARGFETYLMEGKAPSVELRNVFRTFARWLTRIYQNVKGNLSVNLDAEMKQVFDRLIATEEQIEAAEARGRYEPMFTNATMAGMSEDQFAKYQKQQDKVKDKQTETLRDEIIGQLTRQTKKWWKEEKQDLINTEKEILEDERVYTTIRRMKEGDIKIDFATAKEMFGEEKIDKRGRKSIRLNPKLTGMTVKEGRGVHPDEAAAILGYGSGSEMINDIINAPSIDEVAEARAEAQMVERHGDIMTDGTIERAADDAVQNEERGKLILNELKILSKGTAVPDLDRQTIKNIAIDRIGKLSFREIHPGKYRKAEIRAAQESTRMFKDGDLQGAAAAKMRQVVNYYLGMEAANAKADTMKIVDRMSRYNKKSIREEIMKADGGYWDQITKILNRFEFRKSISLKSVDAINTWFTDRTENHGDGLVLSNEVLDELYVTHWKNTPYSVLQGINDSVKNIEHVARYSNKIKVAGEEIEFKKLMQKWVTSIETNEERFSRKDTRSRVDDSRDLTVTENVRRWAAQLTKIPFLASWLDGGQRVGISHDILIQPLTDALDAKMNLIDEVASVVNDAIKNRSKEDQKRHAQKIFIPEINDNLFGHQIIAVALNCGNDGNLRKLLLGEGWANKENESEININNPKLQAILSHLTETDINLVQLIWDQMQVLYPKLAEVHKNTTGLTPPEVKAVPLTLKGINLRGGYYPVKYSPKRSHKAEKNAEKRDAETESLFNNIASIQASVNTGATNERTGFYDYIHLSLDVVPEHFNETIHYITHHGAVRQINRLIQSPTVANAITGVLGESEFKLLKPWLNDVAKDGRQQPVKTYIDEAFHRLRFGVTLGVMGFKASTGIMQLFGLFTTAAEVGTKQTLKSVKEVIGSSWYMKAIRRTLGSTDDIQTSWDFATERSKVMSHRVETMDREIKNAMSRLKGKTGYLAAVQETSMKHIALVQTYMVDLPTWVAAYDKKISETGDERLAINYADWAVENLQGSGATKDMASLMRSQSKLHSTYTMFMTFFSSLGGLSRDLVKGSRSGLYSPTTVAAKLMFLYTLPVFTEMLMRGELDAPDDDDDDKRMQKFLTGVALYPLASIPFVRDVAGGLIGEYGYNSSPVASILEKGISGYKGLLTSSVTDKEVTKSNIKNVVKFTGAIIGIPCINQVWATGEHLYDVIEEGEDLTIQQLLFGPKRKGK